MVQKLPQVAVNPIAHSPSPCFSLPMPHKCLFPTCIFLHTPLTTSCPEFLQAPWSLRVRCSSVTPPINKQLAALASSCQVAPCTLSHLLAFPRSLIYHWFDAVS